MPSFIEQAPNHLSGLIPEEAAWANAVLVIDPAGIPGGRALRLHADALRQSAICTSIQIEGQEAACRERPTGGLEELRDSS